MYNQDYLCHYGRIGMHWGQRNKRPEVTSAKNAYREAKKNRRIIEKEMPILGFGIKGIAKTEAVGEKYNKAQIDVLDKRVAYEKSKKTTEEGKLKIERKVYQRAMNKIGLPGSANDTARYNGLGKVLAKHLEEQKGKPYADSIIKKTQNVVVTQLVAGTAVVAGAAIVNAYLNYRE